MYARVTPVQLNPHQLAETATVIDAKVIPAYQQQAGFRGYWALTDRATGQALAITLWETAEQAAGQPVTVSSPTLRAEREGRGITVGDSTVYEVLRQV